MPAMCDHAADGSEKGDTTFDDGIVQDRRYELSQSSWINVTIFFLITENSGPTRVNLRARNLYDCCICV
ncbi:unnamed protein product [Trichogramma brassicae]|uniref:Uncharacterized protein n=1 Tax=Trichogramma brassicae TaxID=86971 RepID=A0A6H5ILM1_9HYME|nr:unnamed protein product [Trichogramma brassicae]